PGEQIEWSKKLPDTCRLSPGLKRRLELILSRLLESKIDRLMTFEEFFKETDHVLNLVQIYYLNLKRFKLTCAYFEPTQSILKLYDELLEQNDDENSINYNCLFQKADQNIVKFDYTTFNITVKDYTAE
ncbi:unnamed protein product, partial [Rotaria magnacalcarata]